MLTFSSYLGPKVHDCSFPQAEHRAFTVNYQCSEFFSIKSISGQSVQEKKLKRERERKQKKNFYGGLKLGKNVLQLANLVGRKLKNRPRFDG